MKFVNTMRSTIILTIILLSQSINAQIPGAPLSALSPNAASLGIYGDIPISHYTGIPNINIPLYEIAVKDYKLPISLSYHAAGIRSDQRAGWTGLGWTLQTGGIISRSVNDMPDEYDNPKYGDITNKSGYFFNHRVLNTDSWNNRNYLRTIAQNQNTWGRDTSPDEFSFNFGVYSGKFYLDHLGKWVVQCENPVKVEFDGSFRNVPFSTQNTKAATYGYSPCFSGFKITTEDGIQYIFGKDVNAIEFSVSFFDQYSAGWTATSWHLTRIVLPSKNEIVLTYERGNFIDQIYNVINKDLGSRAESSNKDIFGPTFLCSSKSDMPYSAGFKGQLIAPSYLKEISTKNSIITFDRSISNELKYQKSIYEHGIAYHKDNLYYPLPILMSYHETIPQGDNEDLYQKKLPEDNIGNLQSWLDNLKWYKLDKITIWDKDKKQALKTINFNYNNISTQRLILESVKESDKGSYIFTYNNLDKLPEYLWNRVDHWGFFNNTLANLNEDPVTYYHYRNPDSLCLTYGVLKKIQYPTGGYTEFIFEPHSYRKQLSLERWKSCDELASNSLAGGIRIKQIRNSETTTGASSLVKEYFYVSDFLTNGERAARSSGVLGGQIKYYFSDYIVYAYNNKNIRYSITTFSSVSVLPSCHNTSGSHIGYSEVIEKEADGSFSRYKFTNFDNGYMDEPADATIQETHTPYEAYASKSMERGLLQLLENYNANGKKIKEKRIIYEKNTTFNNYVRAMDAKSKEICSGENKPGNEFKYDEGTAYKIYTHMMRPKSETETYYDPLTSNPLQVLTKDISYNNQKLVSSEIINDSRGAKRGILYRYTSDDIETILTAIALANAEADKILENASISYDRCILDCERKAINEDYMESCFNNCETQYKVAERKALDYRLKYSSPVLEQMILQNTLAYPVSRTNIVIQGKDTTTVNATYTSYNLFNNNFIAPEYYKTVNFDKPEKYKVLYDGITVDSRFQNESQYTYDKNNNIKEIITRDGICTSYLWSYSYQYPIAEIRNAAYNEIVGKLTQALIDKVSHADTPADTDLQKIKDLKISIPAAITTVYTYKPLVGMLTATDPTGKITYYNYDVFGRLKETYIMENGTKKTIQAYDYHYQNQ